MLHENFIKKNVRQSDYYLLEQLNKGCYDTNLA